MTTIAQLRKAALSLPEVAEQGSPPGTVTFVVDGGTFASVTGGEVRLCLSDGEVEEVLAAYASAERVATGAQFPLGDIDGQRLNHWVRRAWFSCAPERLVEQAGAAEAATAGEIGDLPRGIGKPATRALVGAGITTLAQVAELTEAELGAMHGVGPKAVRILGRALGENGLSFRA